MKSIIYHYLKTKANDYFLYNVYKLLFSNKILSTLFFFLSVSSNIFVEILSKLYLLVELYFALYRAEMSHSVSLFFPPFTIIVADNAANSFINTILS